MAITNGRRAAGGWRLRAAAYNVARAVPIAAARAARREAELAVLPPLAHDWRAHEAFVGLSLDARELREAERAVQELRARLEALERELGGGTDGSSGSESGTDSSGGRERKSKSESGSDSDCDRGIDIQEVTQSGGRARRQAS